MKSVRGANKTLEALQSAPRAFVEAGRPLELLEEFFAGLPLETLKPLLASADPWMQRAAGFVMAEIGAQACALVEDVVPLLASSDRHAQNYAMETLLVCASGRHARLFAHVVRKVESGDRGLMLQAMDFVARASDEQISSAAKVFVDFDESSRSHREGLKMLAGPVDEQRLKVMLASQDPLTRRYGAIGAKRFSRARAELVDDAVLSTDPDLLEFLG